MIDWSVGAGTTVSPVEPVKPSKAAEIVTGPGATAVASPVELIVAQVVSEEAQVAWPVRFTVVLLARLPVAVNCSVFPVAKVVLAGVTVIDWSAATTNSSARPCSGPRE